jgi:hypothetical protein
MTEKQTKATTVRIPQSFSQRSKVDSLRRAMAYSPVVLPGSARLGDHVNKLSGGIESGFSRPVRHQTMDRDNRSQTS